MKIIALILAAFLCVSAYAAENKGIVSGGVLAAEDAEPKPYFVNTESMVNELKNRSAYYEQVKNEALRAQGEMRVLERMLDKEQDYLEAKAKEEEKKKK